MICSTAGSRCAVAPEARTRVGSSRFRPATLAPRSGWPLNGRLAPRELQQLTLGARRGARLRPIAIVRTTRDAHLIVDADAVPLAEVVVDEVTAESLGDETTVQTWREVEVELKQGDEALLRKVAKWLGKSGAQRSRSASKLGARPGRRRPGESGASRRPCRTRCAATLPTSTE